MLKYSTLMLVVLLSLFVIQSISFANEYVIKEKQEQLVQSVLDVEMSLGEKYSVKSISIEKNRIRVCYENPTKDISWCADLLHSTKKAPGAIRAGKFNIMPGDGGDNRIPLKYLEALAKIVKESKLGEVWSKSDYESDSPEAKKSNAARQYLKMIEGLLDNGLLQEAEAALTILVDLQLEGIDPTYLQARLAVQQGKLDIAEKRLPVIKSKSQQLLEKARFLMFKGEFDKGIDEFKKYLAVNEERNPKNSCDIDRIAQYIFKQGDKEKALAIRRKTALAFDDCTELWERLNESMLDLAMPEEALEIIEPLAKKYVDDVPVQTAYANTLRRLKMRKEASKVFLKLYDKTKSYGFLRMYSTVVSQSPNSMPLLETEREYLKNNPKSLIHRHAAGVLSYYNGFYEDSKNYMNEVRKELPNDARVHIYGAMSRYEMGDWKGAKQWLDELMKIGTTDPDLYYCFAVLFHQKDPKLSVKYIDRYLKVPLHPDSHPPKRAKAIGYRQQLIRGEKIPQWLPHSERSQKEGCNTAGANAPEWLLLMLSLILVSRRRIVRS